MVLYWGASACEPCAACGQNCDGRGGAVVPGIAEHLRRCCAYAWFSTAQGHGDAAPGIRRQTAAAHESIKQHVRRGSQQPAASSQQPACRKAHLRPRSSAKTVSTRRPPTSTTSAAPAATSAPPPTATPRSDSPSAGPSLMPSPTMALGSPAWRSAPAGHPANLSRAASQRQPHQPGSEAPARGARPAAANGGCACAALAPRRRRIAATFWAGVASATTRDRGSPKPRASAAAAFLERVEQGQGQGGGMGRSGGPFAPASSPETHPSTRAFPGWRKPENTSNTSAAARLQACKPLTRGSPTCCPR